MKKIYDYGDGIAFKEALLSYYFQNTNEDITFVDNVKGVSIAINGDIHSSIDVQACLDNGFDIIRRGGGGGAGFLDEGIIMYSTMTKIKTTTEFELIKHQNTILMALLDVCKDSAIKPYITGNDIYIDGKKMCGTSIAVFNGICFCASVVSIDLNVQDVNNLILKNGQKTQHNIIGLNQYVDVTTETVMQKLFDDAEGESYVPSPQERTWINLWKDWFTDKDWVLFGASQAGVKEKISQNIGLSGDYIVRYPKEGKYCKYSITDEGYVTNVEKAGFEKLTQA